MKQFYETYKDNEKLSAVPGELENKDKNIKNELMPSLLAQISWTHNIEIFSRCKIIEEREF